MSSCACYKMQCLNVLFFYLSTLHFTRFSTSFASFVKTVHIVVIGHLCTSPLSSLRRFLVIKMHCRKQFNSRKHYTLLRWETTVYRKSAFPALSLETLVARNLELGYTFKSSLSLNKIVHVLNQFTVVFVANTHSCSALTHCCLFSNSHYYPSYTGLVTALVFPRYYR